MEKDYYTTEEVATLLGVDRSTVYARMKRIGMHGTKFVGDRRVFLTSEQVETLKTYKETPWKVAPKEEEYIKQHLAEYHRQRQTKRDTSAPQEEKQVA